MFTLNPPKIEQSNMLVPNIIDFDWLASQPLLPFLTQVLPTHLLYRSLLAQGFEDSLEVIEWIRGEQLQKILDFDLWEKSFELGTEDISTNKVLGWLQAWLAIGSEFAAERFLELEEETICLILSQLFEIIPEGVSNITEEIRENWWLTHDKKFFLKINTNEEESFEILKQFIDALYAHNIHLTGRLFAYASMLIRQETLEAGLRWRAARITDQGFVSIEEALQTLKPRQINNLKKSIEDAKNISTQKHPQNPFFIDNFNDKNGEEVKYSSEDFDSIVHLLNKLGPDNGTKYINSVLDGEKIKSLTGFSNTSLEQLYDDEDFINEAAEYIVAETKNVILNLEFRSTRHKEANLLVEKAISLIAEQDITQLSNIKSAIAYLANCVTALTASGFHSNAINSSILLTRGAINIGLELCLKMPGEYGLDLKHKDQVLNAVDCLNKLGVNFLFHLGWNLLFKMEEKLVDKLIDIDLNHKDYKGKLNTVRHIKLSDNSTMQVSLDKLVSNLRFADIAKWLSSCESMFSNELFFTIKSLLSRVPHYPKTLNEAGNYVTKETKYFETLEEVDVVFNFITNLTLNLNGDL